MKKMIFTLNVDGYSPEITAITYPLLKHFAKKIGASFNVISERKFPNWPVVYEKLQISEITKGMDDFWAIYIDSDALIHPETPDWTEFIPLDHMAHNGSDFAPIRWTYDKYFQRDGRNIGSCNWFTIASYLCAGDLWRPLDDLTLEQALDNIHPTVEEMATIITREHLIDDYTLSRNIARFGLKHINLREIQEKLGMKEANFHWHIYTVGKDEKIARMKDTLRAWKLT